MTNTLKTCPFCNGRAAVIGTDQFVICVKCNATAPSIEAWNTRSITATAVMCYEAAPNGRTCHMTYNKELSGDEYYPTQAYTCSKCGWITEMGVPRYCPSCGARVVEHD